MRKAVWFNERQYNEYLKIGSIESFQEFVKSAFYDKIRDMTDQQEGLR